MGKMTDEGNERIPHIPQPQKRGERYRERSIHNPPILPRHRPGAPSIQSHRRFVAQVRPGRQYLSRQPRGGGTGGEAQSPRRRKLPVSRAAYRVTAVVRDAGFARERNHAAVDWDIGELFIDL